MKLHLIYFSAAGTTKRVVEAVAEGVCSAVGDLELVHYPLIKMKSSLCEIPADDMALFAVPVYSGRVPVVAAEQISKFKGAGTRAVIVAVYGNREYDDALLELRDLASARGFVSVAAGAFVAEHSIFPKVAASRPDERDLQVAREFGVKAVQVVRALQTASLVPAQELLPVAPSQELLQVAPSQELLQVPGNNPYKTPGSIPIAPRTNKSKCIKAVKKDKELCGICAAACPVRAIGSPKPTTNSDLCIKCAHCIAVCPYGAREWGGLLYKMAEKKFVGAYSAPRKEPVLFYLGE